MTDHETTPTKTPSKSIAKRVLAIAGGVTALSIAAFCFSGCLSIPKGVKPVENFDLEKYDGKWYEIARLDHSFERGLSKVTAEYTIQKDGSVLVVNKGYSEEKKKWKEAEGKAKFVGDKTKGHLKVSFFGPFYGSYVVFGLDPDYKHAYVCGPKTSYLWLLSRTKIVHKNVRADFEKRAKELGFDTTKLIDVKH